MHPSKKLWFRVSATSAFLMLTCISLQGLTAPAADCGIAGSEAAIPGNSFAGYWSGTPGLMRLIETNVGTIEGPASGSSYTNGQQMGDTFQGRYALDTGSFYSGRVTMHMTQGGRCLHGTITYDNGDPPDDILAMRVPRPSIPYQQYYELTDRTEQLKHMVGGILPFSILDGPDRVTVDPTLRQMNPLQWHPSATSPNNASAPSTPQMDDSTEPEVTE
jgi:hypothetical protein